MIDKRCVSLLATVSDWPVDHISALKSFYIHKPGWCRVVMQTWSGTSKRTGDVMQASYVGKTLVGGALTCGDGDCMEPRGWSSNWELC